MSKKKKLMKDMAKIMEIFGEARSSEQESAAKSQRLMNETIDLLAAKSANMKELLDLLSAPLKTAAASEPAKEQDPDLGLNLITAGVGSLHHTLDSLARRSAKVDRPLDAAEQKIVSILIDRANSLIEMGGAYLTA